MGKVKRKATKLLKVFVGLIVSFGVMFSVTACGTGEMGTKDLNTDTGIYLEEESGTEENEDNSGEEEISEEEGGAGESEDDVQGTGDDDSNAETDESEQDNDDSDVTEDDETNSDDDTSIETNESEEDKETETGGEGASDISGETTDDEDGDSDSDTESDDDSEDDTQGTEESQQSQEESNEQSQEKSGTEDTVEETYLEYEEVEGGYKVVGITQDLVYVEIPSTYNGKPVVSIGTEAFKDCVSMVSLTIGENVEEIESDIVEGCYKLIEIYNLSKISNDDIDKITNYEVTNIYSVEEDSILQEENGFIYFISYGEYYIVAYTGTDEKIEIEFTGETVYIYQYAFYGNSIITEVTLGESVLFVMDYAFSYCENLENVTCLGETEIEETAFIGTNIAS